MVDYFLFLAKTITILVAALVFILFIISLRSSNIKPLKSRGRIEFEDLGKSYGGLKEVFDELSIGDEKENKDKEEAEVKRKFWQFWKKKKEKSVSNKENNLYVIDFDGDIAAEAVKNLREEVSAILHVAQEEDEVLVKLKSPGGVVNGYGLAASQLVRIRDKGLELTVAVDEVAASGGYLMACVADHIIASPFAIVGSIGVVAQLPNFHKLMEKFDIDYEQFTAGEYKRTVTMFGENTEEGREKFKEELEEVHKIFKEFVARFRPDIDINQIATGEHWLAIKAQEYGLVDELKTSDSYLLEKLDIMNVYSIAYVEKKSLHQGFFKFLGKLSTRLNW